MTLWTFFKILTGLVLTISIQPITIFMFWLLDLEMKLNVEKKSIAFVIVLLSLMLVKW